MSDRTPRERLWRKADRGFQGYPIGTVAFYGPDGERASNVAVGIVGIPLDGPATLPREQGFLDFAPSALRSE